MFCLCHIYFKASLEEQKKCVSDMHSNLSLNVDEFTKQSLQRTHLRSVL